MAKLGRWPAQRTDYVHGRYSGNTSFHSSCHLPTWLQARVPSSIKWKSYPVKLFPTSNRTMNVKCFAQSLAHRNPHPPAEQRLLQILTSTTRALPDPHQDRVPWGETSHLKPLPASEAGVFEHSLHWCPLGVWQATDTRWIVPTGGVTAGRTGTLNVVSKIPFHYEISEFWENKIKWLTRCQSFCFSGWNLVDLSTLIDKAPFSHFEIQIASDLCIKQHLHQLT